METQIDLETCYEETLRGTTVATGLIRKTTFEVKTSVYDGWVDREGNIIPNESHHHVEKALEIIKSFDKQTYKTLNWDGFNNANRNKGYDAAEFLVIYYGYIAIEGKKAIYSKNQTQKQLAAIGCIKVEDGILIPDNDKPSISEDTKIRLEKQAMMERQYVIDRSEYFSDWKNQFHCPSGCPRNDYMQWQALANKHNICGTSRRTYFTS